LCPLLGSFEADAFQPAHVAEAIQHRPQRQNSALLSSHRQHRHLRSHHRPAKEVLLQQAAGGTPFASPELGDCKLVILSLIA